MRNIITILSDLSMLLDTYDYRAEAHWLDEKRVELAAVQDRDLRRQIAQQLSKILTGMGSLSDIYLMPPVSSEVSKTEANHRLFELIVELDESTQAVLSDDQ